MTSEELLAEAEAIQYPTVLFSYDFLGKYNPSELLNPFTLVEPAARI